MGTSIYGMELRDYFAAKAMQSLITYFGQDGGAVSKCHGEIASEAYWIADAMMKARDK